LDLTNPIERIWEIWSLLANNTLDVYEDLTGTNITTKSTQAINGAMFLMALTLEKESD